MNKIKQRLVHFLSDPSISDRDFTELINWLKKGGIEDIDRKVKDIRYIIKTKQVYKDDINLKRNSSKYNNFNEIERLLFIDAKLTKKGAMELISAYLNIPFNPKSRIGFNQWLSNIEHLYSWSEILHVAHTIRNKRLNEKDENPWPLRNQNDFY